MDLLYRAVTLERAKDGVVSATLSSEMPVRRFGYLEILDHSPESVDLTRALDGLPLLANHDSTSLIGRVENVRLQGRKLKGVLRPGNSPLAEQIFRDISDGILKDVSIGYQINDSNPTVEQTDQGPAYRYRAWQIYEVSTVSIGADPAAGVGRSISITNISGGKKPMEEIQEERKRSAEILALARRHNCQDLAEKAIAEAWSVDTFKERVLETKYQAKPIQTGSDGMIGLTERDASNYSFRRAILSQVNREHSFETEVSDSVSKAIRKQAQGLFIPVFELSQRTMAKGTWGSSGALVGTDFLADNFIELLRNKAKVLALGATRIPGLVGDVAIPKQTGAITAYWVAEGVAATISDAALAQLGIAPKTVAGLCQFTRRMILQATPAIEQLIRSDMAKVLALEVDRVAINGSGVNGQPLGLLNRTSPTGSVGIVAAGVNGAALTWANVVGLETAVAKANIESLTCGYLTTPNVRGALKTTSKAANEAIFCWENGAEPGTGIVNGYRAEVSNNVPSNLQKGTGSNLSAMLFGDFSQLVLGEWSTVDILANPYSDTGNVRVTAFYDVDVTCRYEEAFAIIRDAIAA